MAVLSRRRRAIAIAGTLALALAASACGSGDDSSTDQDSAECQPFKPYQGHDDTTSDRLRLIGQSFAKDGNQRERFPIP